MSPRRDLYIRTLE